MKKAGMILCIIILILSIVGICWLGYGYYKNATMEIVNPVATMEVEGFGIVKMELYPESAPETVANFITLSNKGFYDGLTFHRVVKDFMIQGGDINGDGTGSAKLKNLKDDGADEDYSIKGEFFANNWNKNKIKFDEGTLAMTRSDYTSYSPSLTEESYNSASSQFFIMTKANTSLNGQYAAFGKVIEGMDVVHKIESIEVTTSGDESNGGSSEASKPVNAPKITSMKVETNGVDYGMPTTLTPFDYMTWLYSQYNIPTQQ